MSAYNTNVGPLPFSNGKLRAKRAHVAVAAKSGSRVAWTTIPGTSRFTDGPRATTSPIFFGPRVLQIDFDFVDHVLRLQTGEGIKKNIKLAPKSVAAFYREVMDALGELEIAVEINTTPNEVDPAIPFEKNEKDSAYDPEYANRFWRVLLQSDRVFKEFRSEFCGKCSPVHFFWGAIDLAVTRFSGRRAPPHPGGVPHLPDVIAREAYSHEVSSLGFWPGNEMMPEPIFYSYAYPEPRGFSEAKVLPSAASYNSQLKEFVSLRRFRKAESPDRPSFIRAETYDAARRWQLGRAGAE